MTHQPLRSTRYAKLSERGMEVGFERVRSELQVIIDARPTQIHPEDREGYLVAILRDLEDREHAPWTKWPEDLHALSLTAIRFLGRNPMGSQTLLSRPHLSTLLHHSSLPFPPSDSPYTQPQPSPHSPPAIEALKVLANLLVLHETGRSRFANAGGARAVAKALAGRTESGGDEQGTDSLDRVFLLARLAFLVTVGRKEAVREMVDEEEMVESLVNHLNRLTSVPAHYTALTELFKAANNIVTYYPSAPGEWDAKLDPLLQPTLIHFHLVPLTDLAPPLSSAIHVLFATPFLPRLLPIWKSIPDPPSPSSSVSSVRSLIHKISQIPLTRKSSSQRMASSDSGSGGLGLNTGHSNGNSLKAGSTISRSKSPSPEKRRRKLSAPHTRTETLALPGRVLKLLEGWLDAHIPFPTSPDDIHELSAVDEILPPVVLLLARAAEGDEEFRAYLRQQILPGDLDRSPELGPLEKRRGILGHLLRLMQTGRHFSTRDSAGELIWAICGGDPATMTAEIGYGNAAGFLFHKGITNPPSASVREISDEEAKAATPSIQASRSAQSTQATQPTQSTSTDRDPITALRERMTALANSKSSNSGQQQQEPEMTEEEKEREAERLYTLFKRLEKNPVLSMQSGTDQGEGRGSNGQPQSRSIDQLMRAKLESGDFDRIERQAQEAEQRDQEERDKEDEKQAIREQKKLRMARGIKDWEERHGRCWDTASISDIDDVRWFDHDDHEVGGVKADTGEVEDVGEGKGKGKEKGMDDDASATGSASASKDKRVDTKA